MERTKIVIDINYSTHYAITKYRNGINLHVLDNHFPHYV